MEVPKVRDQAKFLLEDLNTANETPCHAWLRSEASGHRSAASTKIRKRIEQGIHIHLYETVQRSARVCMAVTKPMFPLKAAVR
jgi:hypothetical protein